LKTALIVFASMKTGRPAGKVLQDVGGQPFLKHLLQRLSLFKPVNHLIVATTQEEENDEIETFCRFQGFSCFRSDRETMADHYLNVMKSYSIDAAFKVSTFCPLIDLSILGRAFNEFQSKEEIDVVTNMQSKTFPVGQGVEVFTRDALEEALTKIKKKTDLANVTSYFYDNAKDFKIHNFESETDWSKIKMTVDTAKDMKAFEEILEKLSQSQQAPTLEELVGYYS